jgi:hypothetical protein
MPSQLLFSLKLNTMLLNDVVHHRRSKSRKLQANRLHRNHHLLPLMEVLLRLHLHQSD